MNVSPYESVKFAAPDYVVGKLCFVVAIRICDYGLVYFHVRLVNTYKCYCDIQYSHTLHVPSL